MFITCRNNKCRYYWEDCCTKDLKGVRLTLDYDGKCDKFEAGISDFYKAEEELEYITLKKDKHVTINTNSPYGCYNYYNVVGTDYYINTTTFQIEQNKSVENFINMGGVTVDFTDEPHTKVNEYLHLIEYVKELDKLNKRGANN